MQKKSGCSTKTLNLVLEELQPYLKEEFRGARTVDKTTRKIVVPTGAVILRLNGCVGCNEHVFLPSSRARLCPKCNSPRYEENGKTPKEVCKVLIFTLSL